MGGGVARWHAIINPVLGRKDSGPQDHWPINRACEFQVSEGLCLQKKRWAASEEFNPRLDSGLHMHAHLYIHTYKSAHSMHIHI